MIVGTMAGFIAFTGALFMGGSFWLAFGLYTLTGLVVMTLLPAAQFVAVMAADRAKARTPTDHIDSSSNLSLPEPSTNLQAADVGAPIKILAVDDDPLIVKIISMISAKAGFSEVTHATSGEQALRLLADTDKGFDCLLFDINMPGMGGIELCRQTRQIARYRDAPILMLTAMRDMKNMGEAFRAGASDYATKPFDIEDLGSRLRSAREEIRANRQSNASGQDEMATHSVPAFGYGSELANELRPQRAGSLVDLSVLFNYLTQLPHKMVTDIQVFAVTIDQLETAPVPSSEQTFVTLLEDVAAAAADCFGVDRTVMAYTSDATLLIATNAADVLPALAIEKQLQNGIFERGAGEGIGVSVGGPVQPQSAKAQRAMRACDHATALVGNRVLDKQCKAVVGL
jgi:DNA-binding response OmpR family regulator